MAARTVRFGLALRSERTPNTTALAATRINDSLAS